MTPLYLKDPAVIAAFRDVSATLERMNRKIIAALADPRQDVDASAPGYCPGLSKAVQS